MKLILLTIILNVFIVAGAMANTSTCSPENINDVGREITTDPDTSGSDDEKPATDVNIE